MPYEERLDKKTVHCQIKILMDIFGGVWRFYVYTQ
jgi:hypothetical protein